MKRFILIIYLFIYNFNLDSFTNGITEGSLLHEHKGSYIVRQF